MKDFVAIDFETANNQEMICQIGIVVVKNGEITERVSRYVQPPGNIYNEGQIRKHGITPDRTENEPTFDVVWNEIGHYFVGVTLVSHNHFTEERVLNKNLDRYNIMSMGIVMPIVCTCELHEGRKFKDVCQAYGMSYEKHHDALFDAEGCAQFYLNYLNGVQPDYSLVENTSEVKRKFRSKPAPRVKVVLTDEQLDLYAEERLDSPLFNRKVVITGEFSIGRDNVEWIVKEKHHAIQVSDFSKKVHFGIIGTDPGPSKMEKLDKLIHNGFQIRKIYEEELLSILKGEWSDCHVEEEVKKELDFTYEHYIHHRYPMSGPVNPIARKEIYIGEGLAGNKDLFCQITGNLGTSGDYTLCPETRICVLSDATLEKLKNGEKDNTVTRIQEYYNKNKSITFELSFLSESDVLEFCKSWCERFGDGVTMEYYKRYLSSML